jgi:hypothetical protein
MRRWLWRHPFLALGLCTLLLFLAVEALQAQGATGAAQRLAGPMRTLIIPMYLVWLLFTMLNVSIWGPGGQVGPLGILLYCLQLIGGLVPYLVADYLLHRWRHAKARYHLAG